MKVLYKSVCHGCLPIGTRNWEFYRSLGVQEDRLSMVPYAVNNSYFMREVDRFQKNPALRREIGLPELKPIILFASKLTAGKRPIDLMSAFHQIRSEGIDASLVFVGSGELEPVLKDYAQRHKLEDVYFFGFQNQSNLPRYYAIADVFVLPSQNEPWGLVLNEAMCAALPLIVSSEIGAVSDLVVDGRNGLLFKAGDVNELAEQLSVLLRSTARKEMGRESLRIINKWDYDACVRGIKQALNLTKEPRVPVVQHELT